MPWTHPPNVSDPSRVQWIVGGLMTTAPSRGTCAGLLVIAVIAAACAACSGVTGSRALAEQSRAHSAAGDEEAEYRVLARIRREYPDSPEARELFPRAALLFKKQWRRHRNGPPNSPWLTSEREFVQAWLTHYVGEAFPQDETYALLSRMPHSFGLEFLDYASRRPEFAGWEIRIEEDNGLIVSVNAMRRADR